MTDLRSLLELATDELEAPDLARTALATAARRRTRRRAALAATATGIAVAAAVLVPGALNLSDADRPPVETATATPTPTVVETIPEAAIQPAWDPATAGDLPFFPVDSLPRVVAPVGSSSRPGDSGGPLAVSRSDRGRLAILFGDRGWYGLDRLTAAGELSDAQLSRDGARLAVVGRGGLFWCDATAVCPAWTRVELPERALDEDSRITWTRDSRQLVVTSFRTGYEVDLDSGELTELPFLGDYTTYDVAPDGTIITRAAGSKTVVSFDGTDPTELGELGDLGGFIGLATSDDEIAATRVETVLQQPSTTGDADGLVVLDRDGLGVRAFLPFTGTPGRWTDGEQVRPVQWLDEATVLVSVAGDEQVHLVAWNTRTGALGDVASYPSSYEVSLRQLTPS